MIDRLEKRLKALRSGGKRALAFFYTAGYPSLDSTLQVGRALAAGGADIIELGMPFSDPLADGPVIQKSSEGALRNGMSLRVLLDQVRVLRNETDTPVVLMGYLNPILRYGSEAFFGDAASAGVDGIILPELPLEEAGRYAEDLRQVGLAQILLVTPTTPPERLVRIDSMASGFVYCVSMTGVTGGQVSDRVGEYMRGVRAYVTRNPTLVGFGISTADQAASAGAEADGVIIGSALIRQLEKSVSAGVLTGWVREFREALDRARENSPS